MTRTLTPGQKIRVLVCGGRDYRDYDRVSKALAAVDARYPIDVVIHGGARGADELAGRWAVANARGCDVHPADWDRHGKKAGILRNLEMLKASPDCVVAFPGGRGTQHMIDSAVRAGLPVWEVR